EINITKDFKKLDAEINSYDLAHHVGLTLEEEYEFLMLLQEDQRIEFLKRHLQKMLLELDKIAQLKNKIILNGHFKELGGFDLTNFTKQ
ncbi:MAG: peptidase S16, partial [Chitinophagaceae bacterium]